MKKYLSAGLRNRHLQALLLKSIGISLLMLFCLSLSALAQENFLLLQLDSKLPNTFSITRPAEFLSAQSIQRRAEHNVPYSAERDLPVKAEYLSQIRATGVSIRGISKWMNAVLVRGSTSQINAASTLPFVLNTSILTFNNDLKNSGNYADARCKVKETSATYITDLSQLGLWEEAYRAVKIDSSLSFLDNPPNDTCIIAVFDSGFLGFSNSNAFRNLRLTRRVIHTENMIDDNKVDVTADDDHGTNCLSILAGASNNNLINGAAQAAKFALFRTEEIARETQLEPFYWLCAAEKADSLGVDIISSSLGYHIFDNQALNYPFSQLNGNTTLISRAANMASEVGIWVFNSAGNEGNDLSWNRAITAPCDADSVTCVGAINSSLGLANFSSRGPNANGRIKPELTGFGSGVAVVGRNLGGVSFGSGTSYSTPFVAAIAKLVWDYNKTRANFSSYVLKRLMYASTDSVGNITDSTRFPNNEVGYGLPNWQKFKANYDALAASVVNSPQKEAYSIMLYPNPVIKSEGIKLLISKPFSTTSLTIYDVQGVKKASFLQEAEGQEIYIPSLNLPQGLYIVEVIIDKKEKLRSKLVIR